MKITAQMPMITSEIRFSLRLRVLGLLRRPLAGGMLIPLPCMTG
jgi:hypothetical protein